jgi:hypothetical protein
MPKGIPTSVEVLEVFSSQIPTLLNTVQRFLVLSSIFFLLPYLVPFFLSSHVLTTNNLDAETFFLVKYSASGRMLFTVTSDDTSSSSTISRCSYVGVRADGDPVVLGWFSGTDFGIGGYGVTLGNEEPRDKGGEALFVVRFSHLTGSVASFQEVVSCNYGISDSVKKEEANSVRIQAADLDCRAGKMTIAAVFSGVCRVKASSGEEGGGDKKEKEIEEVGMGGDVMQIESVSEIGDGLVLVFDDHIDAEKMKGEIVNLGKRILLSFIVWGFLFFLLTQLPT